MKEIKVKIKGLWFYISYTYLPSTGDGWDEQYFPEEYEIQDITPEVEAMHEWPSNEEIVKAIEESEDAA